jgi:hypothetical protein
MRGPERNREGGNEYDLHCGPPFKCLSRHDNARTTRSEYGYQHKVGRKVLGAALERTFADILRLDARTRIVHLEPDTPEYCVQELSDHRMAFYNRDP